MQAVDLEDGAVMTVTTPSGGFKTQRVQSENNNTVVMEEKSTPCSPKSLREDKLDTHRRVVPLNTSSPINDDAFLTPSPRQRTERVRKPTYRNSDFVLTLSSARKRKNKKPDDVTTTIPIILPQISSVPLDDHKLDADDSDEAKPSDLSRPEDEPQQCNSQSRRQSSSNVTSSRNQRPTQSRRKRRVKSSSSLQEELSQVVESTNSDITSERSFVESGDESFAFFPEDAILSESSEIGSCQVDEKPDVAKLPEPKKRGRKKKERSLEIDSPCQILATESSLEKAQSGKSPGRRKNKLLCSEISVASEHSAPVTPKVEEPLQESPVNIRGRRGSKRPVCETEDSVLESSLNGSAKKSKVPKRTSTIECGVCKEEYKSKQSFQIHAASIHGGVARPSNEPQEFTDSEKSEAARNAFTMCKKVLCYRCLSKSFTTFLGLKYHLNLCGKSDAELDEMKVQCDFCDFRCLPSTLRSHMMRHTKEERGLAEPKTEQVDDLDTSSASGRSKRRAANKAGRKVASAIEQLKTNEGGGNIDDDFLEDEKDDEYTDQTNTAVSKKFKLERDPLGSEKIYRCKVCDHVQKTVTDIRKHIISSHGDDVSDEESESEESSGPEEDEESEVDLEKDEESHPTIRRPNGFGITRRARSKVGLEADVAILNQERQFRSQNFNQNVFESFHTVVGDWTPVDEINAKDYLPVEKSSANFQLIHCLKNEIVESVTKLKLFESIVVNNAATFFAGGPIWASAWCPLEGKDKKQVIAVSADRLFDNVSLLRPVSDHNSRKSLLQFWTLKMKKTGLEPPVFSFGIAHDFGTIRSLQWCPSGGNQASSGALNRLGLLAAGCEDGTVRIFSVPQFESLAQNSSCPIFKCNNAVVTLKRPDNGVDFDGKLAVCSKVIWFRGRRHRVVAATFSDGYIALWDIETTSSLLRCGERDLLPYRFFRAHKRCNRTFLDLPPEMDSNGFPKYLITGSADRMFHTWDLSSEGAMPHRENRQSFITDVTWVSTYQGHVIVAHDDSSLLNNSRTSMMDVRVQDHTKNVSIIAQNSFMWCQAFNPVKNILVSGTSAGEVIAYSLPNCHRNLPSLKNIHNMRLLLYSTDMGRFNLDQEPNKKDACYCETYSALLKEEPVLKLRDLPVHNYTLARTDDLMAPKFPATMTPENPEVYPIASINTVSVSTNMDGFSFAFSGSQAGLGRIHHMSSLDSYT